MENRTICAVVVTYHPSVAILQNIAALATQVGHVVVVDNTPCSKPADVLNDLERLPACTVIRNGKNLGLATALNIGIGRAIEMGFPWILTSDQDSKITPGYVKAMLSTYERVKDHERVGILCPRYKDTQLGIMVPPFIGWSGDILGCMTSGAMLRAETFALAGPMEERLFIDYVDFEYCERLRGMGFKVIESPEAVLSHSLGRITMHPLFGLITNHSPQRRYYIHRNQLTLVKRYFFKDPEWSLYKLKTLIFDTVMVLLVEDQKMAKAGYMLRALYDGMFNRLGQRVQL